MPFASLGAELREGGPARHWASAYRTLRFRWRLTARMHARPRLLPGASDSRGLSTLICRSSPHARRRGQRRRETAFMRTGFGERFRASRGRSGRCEDVVRFAEEPGMFQGKRALESGRVSLQGTARAHVLRLECSGRWPTRRLCPVIFSRRGPVRQLRGPPFGRDDPHRELERAPVERLRELRDRDKIVA